MSDNKNKKDNIMFDVGYDKYFLQEQITRIFNNFVINEPYRLQLITPNNKSKLDLVIVFNKKSTLYGIQCLEFQIMLSNDENIPVGNIIKIGKYGSYTLAANFKRGKHKGADYSKLDCAVTNPDYITYRLIVSKLKQ